MVSSVRLCFLKNKKQHTDKKLYFKAFITPTEYDSIQTKRSVLGLGYVSNDEESIKAFIFLVEMLCYFCFPWLLYITGLMIAARCSIDHKLGFITTGHSFVAQKKASFPNFG